MKKILFVFGTRPEAIKLCPLIRELKGRGNFRIVVCVTGQHQEMLSAVLEIFGVVPDYRFELPVTGRTLSGLTASVLEQMETLLRQESPDLVLVHGDTSSAFSAALACFYGKIPVGHIEAGLRTYDMNAPYPEEFNRQAISLMASYHFAPTKWAEQNLLREGKNPKTVFVTGNTVVDALRVTVRSGYSHSELRWAEGSRLLLFTAHRRENWGEPLNGMFRALLRIVEEVPDIKVIYPVHKNPMIRETADTILKAHPRIHVIEPLDVFDFHNFLARAYLVLTDSGGIQEEAPSFGTPVLVMRDCTERPEGVEAGVLKLVGTEEEKIYRETRLLLTEKEAYAEMSRVGNPYGDGTASKKIADVLERILI